MKLLFVHSNRFYKDKEGNVFSGGAFPPTIWKNYLTNFQQITFYGRKSTTRTNDQNNLTNLRNIEFVLTDKYSSGKDFIINILKIRNELKPLIYKSDITLARLPSLLGYIAIYEASKQKKPIWVEQVGNGKESFFNHGSLIGKLIAYPLDLVNKHLIKKAHFVSYVTTNKLQEDYPASQLAQTIALSDVYIEKVFSEKELDIHRYSKTLLKICLIGALDVDYKGQKILLTAISLLPDNIKNNIEVNFIGGGDSREVFALATKLGIQHNINHLGPLEAGKEINDFLSKMSLYVQCSLTEGLPRAMIEAMANGCPVIGSNVGGIPELVNPKYIHKAGDVKKLSDDIACLYENRQELYNEAYRSILVANKYHIDNLTKKRQAFYETINDLILNKKHTHI